MARDDFTYGSPRRSLDEVERIPIRGKYPYLDAVQVWLRRPLRFRKLLSLRRLCGSLNARTRPMQFHPEFRQRLRLRQPSEEAVRYLHKLMSGDDVINYVELALDLIVDDIDDAHALQEFFERHWVKKWPGKRRCNRCEGTAYWSEHRWVRNAPVLYCDRPSKVTGEVHCVHLEWRTSSADAVRKLGIKRLADLGKLDHTAFWRKRIQLEAIDLGKLGRAARKTRRSTPWIVEWIPGIPFDMDRRIGYRHAQAAQNIAKGGQPVRPFGSVQEIKASCLFDIRRAISKMPAEKWLP